MSFVDSLQIFRFFVFLRGRSQKTIVKTRFRISESTEMTLRKHRKTGGQITATMRDYEKPQIRDFRGLMFCVGFNRFSEEKRQKKLKKALEMGPKQLEKNLP